MTPQEVRGLGLFLTGLGLYLIIASFLNGTLS